MPFITLDHQVFCWFLQVEVVWGSINSSIKKTNSLPSVIDYKLQSWGRNRSFMGLILWPEEVSCHKMVFAGCECWTCQIIVYVNYQMDVIRLTNWRNSTSLLTASLTVHWMSLANLSTSTHCMQHIIPWQHYLKGICRILYTNLVSVQRRPNCHIALPLTMLIFYNFLIVFVAVQEWKNGMIESLCSKIHREFIQRLSSSCLHGLDILMPLQAS